MPPKRAQDTRPRPLPSLTHVHSVLLLYHSRAERSIARTNLGAGRPYLNLDAFDHLSHAWNDRVGIPLPASLHVIRQ
jgi:hypothetical protein